jgi:hypothetical protein
MTYFAKINQGQARRVLNVLLEAPFFYRTDDEELFLFLRRNRAELQRFFAESFDWELLVDQRCARLYKSRWHNPALKPSQHDVFDVTRRNDCIAFLLMLEYYEHLLDEQNLSVDDPEPPRFYFGSLFRFAVERFAEVLGDGAPGEVEVRKLLRGLVPTLLRYRLLRELEPPPGDPSIDRENLIYECLPGLRCYDVRALGPQALASFIGETDAETEVMP